MPSPTTPTITLSRLSTNSFRAAVTGDGGVTNRLFYRRIWDTSAVTGPTRTGNGNIDVSSLSKHNAAYLVWVVADNGEFSLPAYDVVTTVDPDTVAQAVRAKWDSLPNLVGLAGNLYTQEVPEQLGSTDIELPYSWVNVGKSFFEWTFTNVYIEMVDLEFHILNRGLQNVETAAVEFRENFDWLSLTFSSPSRTVAVHPTDHQLTNEMVRYKDGHPVYRSCTRYQVWVERNLSFPS